MKQILYILSFLLLFLSCKQENQNSISERKQSEKSQEEVNDNPIIDSLPQNETKKIIKQDYQEYLRNVNLDSIFEIVYIENSPVRYLKSDFNGDKNLDLAFLIRFKKASKSHNGYSLRMIIFHSKIDYYIVGSGDALEEENYSIGWLDNWKTVNKGKVYRTIFDENNNIDTEEFNLERKAIALFHEGTQIGLIYWNDQKYVYIHQGT